MGSDIEGELKQVKKRIIMLQLVGAPGAILLGLGLYGMFGANGNAFHPLLNNKNVVAGLVILGIAIEIWQFVVLIPLVKKQIRLINERDKTRNQAGG